LNEKRQPKKKQCKSGMMLKGKNDMKKVDYGINNAVLTFDT
jgi:hypothetical protein